MKKAIISFVISAVLGFGLGYIVYEVILHDSGKQSQSAQATDSTTAVKDQKSDLNQGSAKPAAAKTESAKTAVDPDNILSKRGCLGCHSVAALNLKGGQVGPDLSHAYAEVQGKHGMPIEDFLKKPNSAVMSGVLGNNPLTDDQRKQVLDLLKKASETNQ